VIGEPSANISTACRGVEEPGLTSTLLRGGSADLKLDTSLGDYEILS
jgi:hypothetical protein